MLRASIVNDWIAIHGRGIDGIAWEPDITAQRLIAWLSHSPVVLQNAERLSIAVSCKSLAFQVRYLRQMAATTRGRRGAVAGPHRACHGLGRHAASAPRRCKRPAHISIGTRPADPADGGHISRNPRIGARTAARSAAAAPDLCQSRP